MDNDKSILEKITDKVKEITDIASHAVDEALKPEEPPRRTDEPLATYIPLAADGLISDPMALPPFAVAPARARKHAAPEPAARVGKKPAKAAVRKSAGKNAKRSAKRSAKKPAKKSVKKSVKKSAKQSVKTSARKSSATRSRKTAKSTASKTSRKSAKKMPKKGRKRFR
jgi:hypothetical protein